MKSRLLKYHFYFYLFTFFSDWQDYLNIGAINCAEQENFDTCVSFGINAYPTIKV